MREPLPIGTAIDLDRMRSWATEFAGYRVNVTEQRIDRWLEQFRTEDRDLAARVLDSVHFVGAEQVAAVLRASLNSLEGWSTDAARRRGRWFFVPFSGSSGTSGDVVTHKFRNANNLGGRRFDEHFVYRSDLVGLRPGPDDTVVLIDDFSGTGEQACNAWEVVFRELLPLDPRVILLLVAASDVAQRRIRDETEMQPVADIVLTAKDCVFDPACRYFTDVEKNRILQYGLTASPSEPIGRGDGGFVLVFSHTCPNNSLPILHARRIGRWEGLFRRYD